MTIDIVTAIIYASVSGVVGGVITGTVAFLTMRVELRYLRRDVNIMMKKMGLVE